MSKILALFLFLLAGGVELLQAQESEVSAEAGLANAYFIDREWDQALAMYEQLHRQEPKTDLYIERMVECYVQLKRSTEATAFLQKVQKQNPDRPQYAALQVVLLDQDPARKAEADNTFATLVKTRLQEPGDFELAGAGFVRAKAYARAEALYQEGRRKLNAPEAYSEELANVYAALGQYDKATAEWLAVLEGNRQSLATVQRSIALLTSANSQAAIEKQLLQSAQKAPNNLSLRELLLAFYLQTENYSEALLQAKALDRQRREGGTRLYKLALMMQRAGQYELSNEALDYIATRIPDSPYSLEALAQQARNFELKAFATRPLDTTAVRLAVANYDRLFDTYGRNETLQDAMLNKARLCIFYLGQLTEAERELREVVQLRANETDRAEALLLLGDVHLLRGEYNEAAELYARVESEMLEGQTGAKAKFRSARLSYFKGDFELAKARLKTLKDNTSDDISNDAIKLFLVIQDNLGLDSATTALQLLAKAQLMIYQRSYSRALPVLDSLLVLFPRHPITDEAQWEKANVLLALGRTVECVQQLDAILTQFPDDVLADDALFLKAELYQYTLQQPEQAQQYYLDLLTRYPASLYKVEARKRIRKLRGEPDS